MPQFKAIPTTNTPDIIFFKAETMVEALEWIKINLNPANNYGLADYTEEMRRELFSICSGHYLGEEAPLDFFDWDEEDQNDFYKHNTWCELENLTPDELFNLIDASVDVHERWMDARL